MTPTHECPERRLVPSKRIVVQSEELQRMLEAHRRLREFKEILELNR